MNTKGAAVQGSGWVWLALDKDFKRPVDPLVTKGPNLVPLIGIDVWEHAYYLQGDNYKHPGEEYGYIILAGEDFILPDVCGIVRASADESGLDMSESGGMTRGCSDASGNAPPKAWQQEGEVMDCKGMRMVISNIQ
ncbi:superoxide dismutase [Mn], mitochondrial-like protein [Tanacetum coccineum]